MVACPSCGANNPEGFRFCGQCASALDAAPPSAPSEERKTVTVLFCDLVGFTARSDEADPEEVRATIAPYHRMLRREIERFGGTVEKFIGDAVMAVFGAPVVHEDDAERAIRAALRILDAMKESEDHADLSVRIGINTGEAVVTLDARPDQGEGFVTGDVVNTASRLQGVAPVDGIVVGQRTYDAARDIFEWEALEPVTVKGKAEAIPIWRPVAARSRFGVDLQEAPTTPFVGREDEVAILTGALRRAIRTSSCQLVTIVGEPGVGKSRLVGELSRYVDEIDELVSWRQGRCLPYGDGITFWALGEIVKAHAGILESDGSEEASAKLGTVLRPLLEGDDRTWVQERLKPLIGLSPSSGDVQQEELFGAWRAFLEAVASVGPLVIVLEDLHWADPALLSFVEYLAEYATTVPILVVCTARPELFEPHPGWAGGQRNATTISLVPLTDAETSTLIAALLENAVLPAEIHMVVLERAGGNPLYAEEFVRMLKDRGVLEHTGRTWTLAEDADVPLPETVHALIAARLDTLPGERKALIHDAAVIGKVFWAGAVAAVGDRRPDEVRAGLHELAKKELIRAARTSTVEGEHEYAFWHTLVRDVAYSQIPRASRAAKHVAAADWIEGLGGARVADHAEVLAHHYRQALDLGVAEPNAVRRKVARYLTIAAERAQAVDAARAVTLYRDALEALTEDDDSRAEIMVRLAEALETSGELAEAAGIVDGVLGSVTQHEDPRLYAVALLRKSHILQYTHGAPASRALLEQAISILETLPPSRELAWALADLGGGLAIEGLPDRSGFAQRGLALGRELGLADVTVKALIAVGLGTNRGDQLQQGLDALDEALEIARTTGLGRETALVYNNAAIMRWSVSGPEQAVDICDEGLEFAERCGFVELAAGLRSSRHAILFDLGRWDESARALPDDISEGQARDDRWLLGELLAYDRRLRAYRRIPPVDDVDLIELATILGVPDVMLLSITVTATELLIQGDTERAELALTALEELGDRIPWQLGDNLSEIARVLAAQSDEPQLAKLVEAAPTSAVRHALARRTAAATLAELRGDWRAALDGYQQAAEGWRTYGSVVEEAHAWFGVHRCASRLGREDEASTALGTAKRLIEPLDAPNFTALLGPPLEGRAGRRSAASG